MVTFADLEDFLEDDGVHRQFLLIGIDPQSAWMLFMLLDDDESGLIDITEFVAGCMRLRGECQRLDLQMMMYEMMRKLDGLERAMQRKLGG